MVGDIMKHPLVVASKRIRDARERFMKAQKANDTQHGDWGWLCPRCQEE